MDTTEYARVIQSLRVGKHLPDAIYLHTTLVAQLGAEVAAMVQRAAKLAKTEAGAFHVVKLAREEPRVSLLAYPTFFDEAFPPLAAAWAVDLVRRSATVRRYAQNGNPPILHRKETLLPATHERVPEFAAVTKRADELGLLDATSDIGTLRPWEARLLRVGLRCVGNELVPLDWEEVEETDEEIARHRTALARYALSTPMKALWRAAYLDGEYSVFDYGCGRGDDMRALADRGLRVGGWDPHFAKDRPKEPADVVNLGFVLNVIEDPRERREALLGAWQLTSKVLAVSVLIGGRSAYEKFRLFRDGVLTARGTFQKYFTQSELRQYLEDTLGREPVPMAPGLFFVFPTDEEEQRFLASKQVSRRPCASLPRGSRGPREPKTRRATKWEVHAELLDAFWTRAVDLGRLPDDDEFVRAAELRDALGTGSSVFNKLVKLRGGAEIDAARAAKMDDILVYLALNVFERRKSFGSLPESLRRDIRAFWSNYANAQTEAQTLLFSAGRVEIIHEACKLAASRGLGYLDGNHSLQLHTSIVRELPAVLRVYINCAARLYGDVESGDVVKIHIGSGKLTLMMYDDFLGKAVPMLFERIKIDLRRQDISFFEYGEDTPPQPIYLKARLLRPGMDNYDAQVAFDQSLTDLGVFDLSGFGPDAGTFEAGLAASGRRIRGFKLVRRKEGASQVALDHRSVRKRDHFDHLRIGDRQREVHRDRLLRVDRPWTARGGEDERTAVESVERNQQT